MSNCGACDLGKPHAHVASEVPGPNYAAPPLAVAHNGPVCGTCGATYIGHHTCSPADIMRRINELMALLPGTEPAACRPNPAREGCPCRPENGGSGICGCILGGVKVSC